MENKRGFIMRNGTCVGMDVQRVYASTPIGIIQPFASDTNIPRGYLLCDGASYKVADYPDLYAVIGNTYGGDTENFNVPDYRETVLVGVGENTTDTIASHDIYELGEFKDDQLQYHYHGLFNHNPGGDASKYTVNSSDNGFYNNAFTGGTMSCRSGTTTHGKQKGVTYIIKAFHTNEGVDSGVSDDVINYVEGEIAKVDTELGEKVDYKVVVEDGSRYVEDIVAQDINTWLPNDNSSILINLKKLGGSKYANFQLLCNKQDSMNWSCIVSGSTDTLWKIRYVNGVRYVDELVTMDKVANSIIRESRFVLYNLNNTDNIEIAIDIAKSGYKPIAVSLFNAGTHLWFAQGMYFNDTLCNLSLRGSTPSSATNAKCEVLVTYIKTS